jgi:hypothetical protein
MFDFFVIPTQVVFVIPTQVGIYLDTATHRFPRSREWRCSVWQILVAKAFVHKNYAGAVTISGKISNDAKIYQEKQVEQAVEQVKVWKKVIYTTSG